MYLNIGFVNISWGGQCTQRACFYHINTLYSLLWKNKTKQNINLVGKEGFRLIMRLESGYGWLSIPAKQFLVKPFGRINNQRDFSQPGNPNLLLINSVLLRHCFYISYNL